jgi:demethylmenaquinone methyltransferase/2-methoxy-6-polyprenyl-1,4-benzoquinol methylase
MLMKTQSAKELVPRFFEKTARTYDKIVNLTTFGKDKYWKKEIIKKIPNCNSVLDLACGTGILTFQIAEKLPTAKILGVDITENYLEIARKKLKPYQQISFLCQDAEKLNLDQKFDCITSSYIPKYCKAETLIKICLNHLNPGGKIILHDFTYPKNKIVRSLWNLYFVVLHVVGYLLPDWKDVFVDLPKLIRETRWFDDYEYTMKKYSLQVDKQSLTWNTSAILTGIKKI